MRYGRFWGLAGAAAVFSAVTACGPTVVHQPVGTMMRGGPMMTPPTGYHYPRLTCAPPVPLPGATVTVMLGDMGLSRRATGTAPRGSHMMLRALPGTVPGGSVSLVAYNLGWRAHELVVLPLPRGAPAGQRVPGRDGRVDESGSLGEASSSCVAGSGKGISPGTAGWVTLPLAPGRYELICNLANHYASGMWTELDVT